MSHKKRNAAPGTDGASASGSGNNQNHPDNSRRAERQAQPAQASMNGGAGA